MSGLIMNALIIVDVQYDFLPGGALAVPEGDQIIPVINRLMPKFDIVVATQDWHPLDHGSFATNHKGRKVGDTIDLNGLEQILWPVHCVQGTYGAELSKDLNRNGIKEIFTKGTDPEIDSYSGFFDNGHRKSTGLAEYLRSQGVEDVYITGLAGDYCVKFTALDARKDNFNTYLVKDATRAINQHKDDFKKALEEMKKEGVQIMESSDILEGSVKEH
jgi:nicotinamidase/pyrazinamidase